MSIGCQQCAQATANVLRMGPYEWAELTYSVLRVAPEGEAVAHFNREHDAWVTTAGEHFSDVLIEAT